MEWPQYAPAPPQPVFVNAVRPARGRPRQNSEHPNRAMYLQDHNGMLVPAAPAGGEPMYRSQSNQERPASVIIHNSHSPVRHHRRGSHGHDDYYYYDDWSDCEQSPRGRHRAHSHHGYGPSRSPSPRYQDPVLAERLKRLEDLEKAEEEKAQRKAIEERKKIEEFEKKEKEKKQRERYKEEEMIAAEKKRQEEAEEKKRKEAWVEEWKREQDEKKKKEEEKKKKEYEEFRERTFKTFSAAGYSDEAIEKMLRKAERAEKRKEGGHKEKAIRHVHEDDGKQLMRPTYIKVHKKYMSTETLDEFDLPWELDIVSPSRN